MSSETTGQSYLERRWAAGQDHLAAGHYVAARRDLEVAEAIAWREKDARSLARVYLPLLEARRQIRYNAAEGLVVICPLAMAHTEINQRLHEMLQNGSGTILLQCSAGPSAAAAQRFAGSVQYAARRTGTTLEALLLVNHGHQVRLATPADPTFVAGLTVQWTGDAAVQIGATTESALNVPLPPPAVYGAGDALHALTRESLIVAWEALALRWQHRHPAPHEVQPWEEIAWLRLALRIDPACEPISMRLMSLAETVERSA